MIQCAVVGNPVSHSLSPIIHQHFAKQARIQLVYEKIQTDDGSFSSTVTEFFAEGGRGLNITLPFKEHAFRLAALTTPRCNKAGAANTLWMAGTDLWADNTDGIGLLRDLNRHLDLTNKRVMLLGAGGAARGVINPLLEASVAQLCVVNRTMEKCQALQKDFPLIKCMTMNEVDNSFDLVINATSIGLTDKTLILPESIWQSKPFCYDLAYKVKRKTGFVQEALQQGCQAADGLGMLVEQAAESFFIWHGFRPETVPVLDFLRNPANTL